MVKLLRNFRYFSIFYFIIVCIDLSIRLFGFPEHYTLFSRPLIILPLLMFYIINNKENKLLRKIFVIGALVCFFLGELFIAIYESIGLSSESIFCYMAGKVLLIAHFSNQKEFNIKRLIFFLIFIFILIIGIMSLIYENLGNMFLPILIYLFVSVILLQFTLMRKNDVNDSSYLLVFYGMMIMVIGDCLPALKFFYFNNSYINDAIIVVVFAISHCLTVIGITKEEKKKENPEIV